MSIKEGVGFSQQVDRHRDELLAQFHRQGYLVLRNVLDADQIEVLKQGVLAAFDEPDDGYGSIIRVQMFERDPIFEDMVDFPGVIDLLEAILGTNCHLCAQAAAKTSPGNTIGEWHVDDDVRFPLPSGYELPPEIPMPCTGVHLIYYLVDVPLELGPTQLVPGSHRSGFEPAPYEEPSYKGQGPVSAVGRAGDLVFYHHAVWHRGGPNSAGTRVTLHAAYGSRFIAQRFYPFMNYRLPTEILERSSPRRRRLYGLHPRGDD